MKADTEELRAKVRALMPNYSFQMGSEIVNTDDLKALESELEAAEKANAAMTKVLSNLGVTFREDGTPLTIPFEVASAKDLLTAAAERERALREALTEAADMITELRAAADMHWELKEESGRIRDKLISLAALAISSEAE